MPFGAWEDFNACIADMMRKGYDGESAKRICGSLKARLEGSPSILDGNISVSADGRNLIRGEALHPIKTFHPEEWPSVRVYLDEELAKATETLIGKPLLLDHAYLLDGKVLDARYEDGAIKYVAELNEPEIIEKIRDGRIRHVSVECDWGSLERVNGVAPRNIEFTGLSLLERLAPGDPKASVSLWEGVIARLRDGQSAFAEMVWTRKYINDLPDDAFAIILPGGEKDEEGKTRPRSLRKFPHHRADGSIDLPHLRNANARVSQSGLTEEQKRQAQEHLDRHKKALGIGEFAKESREPFKHVWKEQEIEFNVAPEPTLDDLIESIENVVEQIEDRFEAIESKLSQNKEAEEKQTLARELAETKERVKALEVEKARLIKRLGEAVIEPNARATPAIPLGYVHADDILKSIPRWIPSHWGYGPFKVLTEIREKCLKAKREAAKI